MADIETYLRERASAVAPTAGQLDAAARSHNFLRDELATGQMDCRILKTYLSGSYARNTAIRPLDDVDVIFEIDPTMWAHGFLATRPRPTKVLETFARAIRRRYDASSVRTQRRSVRLRMNHLDIDVVPAIADSSRAKWLWVGDADSDDWIASAPLVHAEAATTVNQKCGGQFKALVRLLKAWNGGLPTTASLRSFAIETIATRLFDTCPTPALSSGVFAFFDFVCGLGGQSPRLAWSSWCGITFGWFPKIPDVAGSGSNLLAGVDSDRLRKFVHAAQVMRDGLENAQRARTSEIGWAYVEPRFRGALERV